MTVRRFLTVLAVVAAVFVLGTVVTWPSMFVSQEEELTGLSFDLRLIKHIDDGSRREGKSAWIYEIPEPAAADLAANPDRLRDYPMQSALLLDGYRRLCWTPLHELQSGHERLLVEELYSEAGPALQPRNFERVDDAQQYASQLARDPSSLIGGWYTHRNGKFLTNYFIYVINPRRRILVKLSLLT